MLRGVLGSLIDLVTQAQEATPEHVAARERSGQVRTAAAVVLPLAAFAAAYYATQKRARR
jgi:hypothetical protein